MTGLQPAKRPRVNSAFKQLMSVHWLMAACYLVLFTTGIVMTQAPGELFFRASLYDFHKSIGSLVMALLTWRILVLLRVWWRKYTKRSPKFTPEWIRTVTLHMMLYVFMWAVPVSGYFLSNSYMSQNVRFFGVLLPDVFPQNSAQLPLARGLHFWLSYTFLTFILLHIIAQWKVVRALWRRFSGSIKARFASVQH